ncbi:MAG: DUF3667 domain-containing protein [Rhizobacter sp.]|nr:DUF3667 domain-containing protein [Ferruginibacter sp.]
MSHLKERKNKNCLNCNAQVHGKYCHICGQENLEPAESAWHLITHFFNDITHFDGKFFSTLKLLITKPGFLSAEYKRGRRASYLNPIRMYVFTSFIFFIIFYSYAKITDDSLVISGRGNEEIQKMDSTEFADFTKEVNDGKPLTRTEYKNWVDSVANSGDGTIIGKHYDSEKQYDSLLQSGEVKDNWLWQKIVRKNFEINKKYKKNRTAAVKIGWEKVTHSFPQVLFISLPFFAIFLTLIYFRHKDYYFVSHGIFSVHIYIFYFIALLLLILLNMLGDITGGDWLDWVRVILLLILFIYEYKAMRHFYGQRRFKTIVKFLMVIFWRSVVIIALTSIFFILSFLNL